MRILPAFSVVLALTLLPSCKKEGDLPVQDPVGYFTYKGEAPKGFEEIDWICINPKGVDAQAPHDSNWGSDFPHGLISLKNKKRIKFQSFSINGDRLSFESVAMGGIAYKFDGTFGPQKAFDDMQKDFAALSGVLVKRSKQGDSQTKVEFYWFNGD